jgi:hypothetical protein
LLSLFFGLETDTVGGRIPASLEEGFEMKVIYLAACVAALLFVVTPAGAFDLFHPEPSAAETEAADDVTCRGYGVARGSNNYVACRMNLANNRASQGMVDSAHRARKSRLMMLLGARMLGGY